MEEIRTNVEEIIKIIVQETIVKEVRVFDGISIEAKIPDKKTFKQCKISIDKICKKYNFIPVTYEEREDENTYFLIQFPELVPYYTEEQLHNMFYKSIDYFLDTSTELSKRSGVIVTRKMLLDSVEKYIYETIKLYYNWNVNKYKVTLNDLKNDVKLRTKIRNVFNEVYIKYV